MNRPELPFNGIGPDDRFAFEEQFDVISCTNYLKVHRHWIIIISALYVILVFTGQKWMENRPAYRLKGALILWNVLLGGFSLFGVWRSVPVLAKAVFYNGFHSTVCDNTYYHKDFFGVWGVLFTVSKIPEFGDTFFIVLRKQKLIFLHWYHHATVPIFVIIIYSDRGSLGVWFTVMNFVVHGIMYPYYGLRSAGIRLPKPVAMTITTFQIAQMLMGNALVIYAAAVTYSGGSCDVGRGGLIMAVVFYFSYLILFAHFFYGAYVSKKPATNVHRPLKDDDDRVAMETSKDADSCVVRSGIAVEIRNRKIGEDWPKAQIGKM